MLALLDADDRHHDVLRWLFERDPGMWVLLRHFGAVRMRRPMRLMPRDL